MADTFVWTPYSGDAWRGLTSSKPILSFVPPKVWGYIDYNDVTNTARQLKEEFFNEYIKNPSNFQAGVGYLNPDKAEVDFLQFAEKSGKLPDWWIKPAREWAQTHPSLAPYLDEIKNIKPFGSIEFTDEGYKPLKPATQTDYTIRKDKEYQEQLLRHKEAIDRAIGASSVEEAKNRIWNEIGTQRDLLKQQGINWSGGISDSEAALMMADKLANAGVKTISDLEIKNVQTGDDGVQQLALVNKRTGEAIPPEYAFAQIGESGGTWGGTFAGPGSTRFNIDFVNGLPVFSTQQQGTVKSGIEKLAGIAAPIALGLALGPGGLGLSNIAAGALAGGAGGLLKSGDLSDALKGAALGAAGGFAKEALLGGEVLTGDPTRAALYGNAGYGEGLLNMVPPPVITEPVLVPGDNVLSSTLAQPPLAVENISGQLTPEAQTLLGGGGIAAGTAASDLAAIEASMGTPSATGSATKAALLGDTGYGPGLVQGEAPIIESTPTSMGPGKEVSGLQVAKDIVTSLPGASKQYLTTALTTLGLDPDVVNNIIGWKPSTASTTTQTGGGGSNFLGPVIGGLLSRQQQAAPSPGVTQGRAVDITSPIQSLLAPKLVQQRPVTLL